MSCSRGIIYIITPKCSPTNPHVSADERPCAPTRGRRGRRRCCAALRWQILPCCAVVMADHTVLWWQIGRHGATMPRWATDRAPRRYYLCCSGWQIGLGAAAHRPAHRRALSPDSNDDGDDDDEDGSDRDGDGKGRSATMRTCQRPTPDCAPQA